MKNLLKLNNKNFKVFKKFTETIVSKIIDNDKKDNKLSVKYLKEFVPGNNKCVDCEILKTEFYNLLFGIFLCVNCSNNHILLFGDKYVKELNKVYNNESLKYYNILFYGGNNNFNNFLKSYGIKEFKNNISNKYLNKAALYYKIKLEYISKKQCYFQNKPLFEEGLRPVELSKYDEIKFSNVGDAYIINDSYYEDLNNKMSKKCNYKPLRKNEKIYKITL